MNARSFSICAVDGKQIAILPKLGKVTRGSLSQKILEVLGCAHMKPIRSMSVDYVAKKIFIDHRLRICGHSQLIRCLAWSPTGHLFATGSDDGRIQVWNIATGLPYKLLSGHTSGVVSIAICGDGNHLASSAMDGSVCIWDMHTGRLVYRCDGDPNKPVISVAILPNLTTPVMYGRAPEKEWFEAKVSTRPYEMVHTTLSSSGRFVATLYGLVIYITNDSGKRITIPKTKSGWSKQMAFSPGAQYFTAVSMNMELYVWDLKTGKCVLMLKKFPHPITALAISAAGEVAYCCERAITIWSIHHKKCLKTYYAHQNKALCVTF